MKANNIIYMNMVRNVVFPRRAEKETYLHCQHHPTNTQKKNLHTVYQ